MRSCLNGGGGCSPLTTGGGGGGGGGGGEQSAYDGGGGGCSRQVTLINSSLTCTHSLLKHKKHHGKRVHSAPALSCSTASLTFVRTTELSGLLSMAQHVICRSLSSGRGGGGGGGGGRQKAARGRHFIRDGGGGRPPQGYAGSGAVPCCFPWSSMQKMISSLHVCRWNVLTVLMAPTQLNYVHCIWLRS